VAIQTVTGQQIIDLARLYADERPAGSTAFISTTDDLLLVNTEIAALWDLLLSLGGEDYFAVDDVTQSTVAGTATVALPSAFYQLVSVHIRWASDRNEEVNRLTADGDRYLLRDAGTWGEGSQKAYRLKGDTIDFSPVPTSAKVVVVRYLPRATLLTALSESTPSVNGWHELCAWRIAAKMRAIRGQPNSMCLQFAADALERIETIAAERALNEPARIRDVMPDQSRSRWGWLCQ
jgi:hypothetical protein